MSFTLNMTRRSTIESAWETHVIQAIGRELNGFAGCAGPLSATTTKDGCNDVRTLGITSTQVKQPAAVDCEENWEESASQWVFKVTGTWNESFGESIDRPASGAASA